MKKNQARFREAAPRRKGREAAMAKRTASRQRRIDNRAVSNQKLRGVVLVVAGGVLCALVAESVGEPWRFPGERLLRIVYSFGPLVIIFGVVDLFRAALKSRAGS